uniref:Uncharacterized protein n=1 Tax=viral metagenome TaxID=1070528 RepID=A0A6H1ZDW9_9ZZZZ
MNLNETIYLPGVFYTDDDRYFWILTPAEGGYRAEICEVGDADMTDIAKTPVMGTPKGAHKSARRLISVLG